MRVVHYLQVNAEIRLDSKVKYSSEYRVDDPNFSRLPISPSAG